MLPLTLFYALVFLVALLATRASIAWALRHAILDVPNHRSSHSRATPRGGGIGIVVASAAGIAAGTALGWISPSAAGALACGLPIALVGYIDDKVSLSARVRLLVQAACAAGALWFLAPLPPINLFGYEVPAALSMGIYFIATIWLTNLFNFMDGIDGIAAAQTLSAAVVWGLLLGPMNALPMLLIAAATAGFLVFNWPPARIFMGDVGSAFSGFVLMVATLEIGRQSGIAWTALWFLPLAPFILDATVTLTTRLLRGKKPNIAHRSHAYQILSRRYRRHGPVSAAYFVIGVVWFGSATWLARSGTESTALLAFAISVAVPVVILIALGAGRDDS